MQQNHAKALKGLSIAIIVISALALAGCLIGMVFTAVAGSAASTYMPEYLDSHYDSSYSSSHELAQHADDALALLTLASIVGIGMMGWVVLCSVITLVAGIMGVRNCANPAKLGTVFGWGVAGAIIALLSGSFIVMVLCIIMAVFANKDKQLAESGLYGAVAYPAGAAVPPMGAVPVAPAPVAPAAPVAPVAPAAQPVQPTQVPPTNPPMA